MFGKLLQRGKSLEAVAADMQRNLNGTTKANLDDVVTTAKRIVHVRTGRTRASIRGEMQTPTKGTVHADYGGPWEEMRGEPHNFATQAVEEVRPRAIARTRAAIDEAKK